MSAVCLPIWCLTLYDLGSEETELTTAAFHCSLEHFVLVGELSIPWHVYRRTAFVAHQVF